MTSYCNTSNNFVMQCQSNRGIRAMLGRLTVRIWLKLNVIILPLANNAYCLLLLGLSNLVAIATRRITARLISWDHCCWVAETKGRGPASLLPLPPPTPHVDTASPALPPPANTTRAQRACREEGTHSRPLSVSARAAYALRAVTTGAVT